MRHFNKTFSQYCENNFSEYASNVFVNMRKNNKKYKTLYEKSNRIIQKYPKLNSLIFGDDICKRTNLTRKEVFYLKEYFDINYELNSLKYHEMFLMGKKEEYFSLKKMRMIL